MADEKSIIIPASAFDAQAARDVRNMLDGVQIVGSKSAIRLLQLSALFSKLEQEMQTDDPSSFK